jgi:peroxiredoxin
MPASHNLLRVSYFSLLVASLIFSVNGRSDPGDGSGLPATAEEISPLQAGDRVPAFTVRTVDNEAYYFDPDKLQRPTILISFRGGWCPYCNMHLSELRHVIPELRQAGFDVLFLSNDRPELLYESLKKETQETIAGLDYVILSDADLNAARALGTAFRVSDSLVQRRQAKGDDIQDSSIDKYGALTVPAVVVIDQSGKITYIHANPDYKVRLSAEELKEAADRLLAE